MKEIEIEEKNEFCLNGNFGLRIVYMIMKMKIILDN